VKKKAYNEKPENRIEKFFFFGKKIGGKEKKQNKR
jgi:hypothetical protein